MPEAKKEVKSLVSLVSEKQHTKHDCMSFFNLLVLNKDLWGRTRVRRKGRELPCSYLVFAGYLLCLATAWLS